MRIKKSNYSKGDINRAGQVLAGIPIKNISIDDAILILENFRALHIHPMMVFHNLMVRKQKNIDPKALVSQRLKRAPSIINKLKIQKNMALSQMQDIGGIRVVFDSLEKVYELKSELDKTQRQTAFKSVLSTEDDYIQKPKESGYRSLHLVFKYGKNLLPESQCRVEIQVRTYIQHAWATAIEVIGTFLNQPLKQSLGNEELLNLFKEISECFSIIEYNKTDIDLFNKVLSKIEEQKLIDLLNGFTVVTKLVEEKNKEGKYYLVLLDFKKQAVSLKRFSESRLEEANREYTELEKTHLNDRNIEVVLVSVDNISNLKQLYPNFFLDTKEFLNYLKIMKDKVSVA